MGKEDWLKTAALVGLTIWLAPKVFRKIDSLSNIISKGWKKATLSEKATLSALVVSNFIPVQYFFLYKYLEYLEKKKEQRQIVEKT